MRRFSPHSARREQHIWIPAVDVLFVVVAALILRGIDVNSRGGQHERMYRSLEDANLAQASSEGGCFSNAEGVIKVESSGQVILHGKRFPITELRHQLGCAPVLTHYVLAAADTAHVSDAQRVELILREGKVKYTRLFRQDEKP